MSTYFQAHQYPQLLEAAVCRAAGLRATEQEDFKPEVLEGCDRLHPRGIGLQQLLLTAAAANGHSLLPGERITASNLKAVLRAAFADGGNFRVQAASNVSLPGILGAVANKSILAGYMEEDQSWREVAAIKPVNNFQQATSYRLLDDSEFEEVGPDGKIKHGSVGQESYTRQAKTYAKMFTLTRTNIINDDLGAFDDLKNRLGRGGGRKLRRLCWATFMNNSSFYTTARTNYIEGATTNLGTDGVGLGLGVKAFRTMTSPTTDGAKRIGGIADRLVVPPELEGIAEVLYRNQNIGAVAGSDANIYANRYRPVVVPELSDSAYTGYSTTAWYLFRKPTDLAPIVVSFLNGNETPTIEDADAAFDTLGINFRGYWDVGVDQAEYLAGVKSKGAA
jgi:hypothetical protein